MGDGELSVKRTNNSATVVWEVVHIGGDAGSVDPIAAIEGHDSEADHGPVGQRQPPRGRQPQPKIAAEMLRKAPQQHKPATSPNAYFFRTAQPSHHHSDA